MIVFKWSFNDGGKRNMLMSNDWVEGGSFFDGGGGFICMLLFLFTSNESICIPKDSGA